MVMFIYEDPSDASSKGVVKLKIAKHRNGPTGLVRLGFVRDYTSSARSARPKTTSTTATDPQGSADRPTEPPAGPSCGPAAGPALSTRASA